MLTPKLRADMGAAAVAAAKAVGYVGAGIDRNKRNKRKK
jgi:acetyl/propionyl-CoA carboxylase alpha subunit